MNDDVLTVPDDMSDTGKWSPCPCPTCGQNAEMRRTGLRTVAATGDERHAEKQWRPPAFTAPEGGPFVVQEQVGLPGDRTVYSPIDPSTGITTGAFNAKEPAESDKRALNAAFWLGSSHESHRAGLVVGAARRLAHEPQSADALAYLVECVEMYEGSEA